MRTLLWPNPEVLQVVAIEGPPLTTFPGAPLVAVRVCPDEGQCLAASIAGSHERYAGNAGPAASIASAAN